MERDKMCPECGSNIQGQEALTIGGKPAPHVCQSSRAEADANREAKRDYGRLLDRLEERLAESLYTIALRGSAAAVMEAPDAPLWREHAALIRWAGVVVKQWRRELDAEPAGYRAQVSAVELANVLGLRE